VCLTLGPAFISAAIYLCLARIVVVYGEEYSRLKPRTYSLLCASFDLVALLLQSAGGAIAVSADTKTLSDTGIYIMLGGLAFQAFSLILFMSLWAKFYMRRRKCLANSSESSGLFDNPELTELREKFKFKAFQIGMSPPFYIQLLSFSSQAELELMNHSTINRCYLYNATFILSPCGTRRRLRKCRGKQRASVYGT
jgi:hypothetical protein